jgi:hypothetical protein
VGSTSRRPACRPSSEALASMSEHVQYHLGRLIDHVHLRVSDLDASKCFYRAVLASLDLSALLVDGVDYFYLDELFVDKASVVS